MAVLAIVMVGSAASQKPLSVPFDLAVGQSEIVGDEGLRVGFDTVPLDSRCPLGAVCIWEGDAVADMWAERPLHPRAYFKLHSNPTFDQDTKYEGYKIFLVAINPYPIIDFRIDPNDYVITVLVTKTSVSTKGATWGRIKSIYDTGSSDN
jgi:hypothetical protein